MCLKPLKTLGFPGKSNYKQPNDGFEIVNTYVNTVAETIKPQQTRLERRDPHMQKNIKQIMIALDQVLNTTVWVNQDRQIISLSDELHIGNNNAPRSIEDLPRASLIGAYVSLQIRTDNFDVAAETLETHDLALKVKEMVFSEAKKIMDNDATGVEKHVKAA